MRHVLLRRHAASSALVALVGTLAMLSVATGSASAQGVFVNEIHYDNFDADQDEGIEVAGPAGTDLSGYSLELYNGYDGALYSTISLTGVLPDQENGYGTTFFATPSLQNGAPDGIALVGPGGVEELLGYEGTFTAVDGSAAGMSLVDIGRFEAPSTPVGRSLQLQGTGRSATDFAWHGPLGATRDGVNTGQHFPGPALTTDPDSEPTSPTTQEDSVIEGGGSPVNATLACTNRRLALIDVAPEAGRVRLFGAADRSLAGKYVRIVFSASGRTVAQPRVRPDGTFSTRVPLPARSVRDTDRARYQAVIGMEKSLRLKLARRVTVGSITTHADKVTVTGRITGPLDRSQTVTLERRLNCTEYDSLTRFKPKADGRFKITVTAPSGRSATYRLSTLVPAKTGSHKLVPTFSLPRVTNLR